MQMKNMRIIRKGSTLTTMLTEARIPLGFLIRRKEHTAKDKQQTVQIPIRKVFLKIFTMAKTVDFPESRASQNL